MTFQDLQTLASDWLDDPNNGYFTLPVLKQRLNLSARELQKRMISANQEYYTTCVKTNTVANQNVYSLPTDFFQVLRLSYITQGSGALAQEQKIYQMTPNQRDQLSEVSGQPQFYYFQGNNIILAPTPDAIYEVHLEYAQNLQDMVNQTDVPNAPQQYHEYIAVLTTRDCLIKDGRPLGSIEQKLTDYETLLKQTSVQRSADGPRMVTSTNGFDW
jgi:hypothetical protein